MKKIGISVVGGFTVRQCRYREMKQAEGFVSHDCASSINSFGMAGKVREAYKGGNAFVLTDDNDEIYGYASVTKTEENPCLCFAFGNDFFKAHQDTVKSCVDALVECCLMIYGKIDIASYSRDLSRFFCKIGLADSQCDAVFSVDREAYRERIRKAEERKAECNRQTF